MDIWEIHVDTLEENVAGREKSIHKGPEIAAYFTVFEDEREGDCAEGISLSHTHEWIREW